MKTSAKKKPTLAKLYGVDAPGGALGRISRRLRPQPVIPLGEEREFLRSLVRQHKAVSRQLVSITNANTDRKSRDSGEIIVCRQPEDVRYAMLGERGLSPKGKVGGVAETLSKKLDSLKLDMTVALKRVPIYHRFLKHVFGAGPIAAAYLIGEVDIHRATKPSNLRKFCGVCSDVNTGRMPRRSKGQVNPYNASLRVKLYSMMSSMEKNGHPNKCPPFGKTSRYLDAWREFIVRRETSPDFDAVANTWQGRKGAKGSIRSIGMWRACGLFLEDLYLVWRSLEGLDVWPGYHAMQLGYKHGGEKICVNAQGPKTLTVEEALAVVGDVGGRTCAGEMHPLKVRGDDGGDDEPEEGEDDVAAE